MRPVKRGCRSLLPLLLLFFVVSGLYAQSTPSSEPGTRAAPGASSNKDAACIMCHGNKNLTATRLGRKVSLFADSARLQASVHKNLACTACHRGLNPGAIPHAQPVTPVRCESCHKADGFTDSIHATGRPRLTCKTCHGAHSIRPVDDPASGLTPATVANACGKCHTAEREAYLTSEHAHALRAAAARHEYLDDLRQSFGQTTAATGQMTAHVPTCVTCHGAHRVLTTDNPDSPVNRNREPEFCLNCHLRDETIRAQVGFSEIFMSGYASSVHGQALAAGNPNSATCGDCHGAHDSRGAQDSGSKISKWNIATTCGQCHKEVADTYKDSTHGRAVARGSAEAPTCTSCHGDHHIYFTQDERSAVSRANIAEKSCAGCHNSVRLTQKYGIASDRFASFADSFHGLAAKGGSLAVANCASCHGVHNIKPSSDPDSTINAKHLTTTCGNCHPGANENFARGKVHVREVGETHEGVLYWIRTIYLIFIVVVIGLMFLHNLLDFIKRTRRRFAVRWGHRPLSRYGPQQFLRMTLLDRVQHVGLMVSFALLAMTGFMLRYPDAWWVTAIRSYWEQFFALRGIVHRLAAVMIITFSLLHIGVLIFTRHGRKFITDIFPRWSDVRDLCVNVRYLLGLSARHPRFDRFGYIEKAEYWALVWGMVIMFATGIFLWFNNFFISHFTKLAWDISRTVHFYEALLATLAIVVWHFYYVMFNPAIYPMNTAWITGKISEKEMTEEHPLELERLRREAAAAAVTGATGADILGTGQDAAIVGENAGENARE